MSDALADFRHHSWEGEDAFLPRKTFKTYTCGHVSTGVAYRTTYTDPDHVYFGLSGKCVFVDQRGKTAVIQLPHPFGRTDFPIEFLERV